MDADRRARAEAQRQQGERVRALRDHLRDLLEGRWTREELLAWLVAQGKESEGDPFPRQPAFFIHESLYSLNERHGDQPLVREAELRAYLRWLVEGESFVADEEPLLTLARDVDAFAAGLGIEAIRWWNTGLGWWTSFQFLSPHRGDAYVVHAELECRTIFSIHPRRGVDPHAALIDLFEGLAIDERDAVSVDPRADLERAPRWALMRQDDYGNQFEVDRSRSYAKMYAQEREYTARGHRQVYWVDPV